MKKYKNCTMCKIIKPLNEFSIRNDFKPLVGVSYRSACKKCTSKKESLRYATDSKHREYCLNYERTHRKSKTRTVHGVFVILYNSQKYSSKRRRHNPPDYTCKDLERWFSHSKKFKRLYEAWVRSSYKKELKPSIDRLDWRKPYTKDNIQLMTWGENKEKGVKEKKEQAIELRNYMNDTTYETKQD